MSNENCYYMVCEKRSVNQESIDFLIFVEDPGAVNFVADLPANLAKEDFSIQILATGLAVEHLKNRNVSFQELSFKQTACQMIDRFNPKVVILGTSENKRSFAFSLIEHCKSVNLPTIGVIDMAVNADNRFRGESTDPLKHCPQYLVVPDETTRTAFRDLGFDFSKIKLIGHPHYDFVRKKLVEFSELDRKILQKEVLKELDLSKKIVVFLAQPMSLIDKNMTTKASDYTLRGWKGSTKRTDIVIESILDAISPFRDSLHFGLRLHPKNTLDEFEKYSGNLDFVSQGGDPLRLVFSCDVVLGMSTMLLYEAALLQKTVLSILPRESEKNWMPADSMDKIPVVCDHKTLEKTLLEMLNENTAPSFLELEQTSVMEKLLQFLADVHRSASRKR